MTLEAQLCDDLERAGVDIHFGPDGPRLRGTPCPLELKARLQANRDAVLAEWQGRRAERRRRYWQTPPANLPLALGDTMPAEDALPIMAYVARQCLGPDGRAHDRKLRDWIETRAAAYYAAGLHAEGQGTARACLDLVCWQRDSGPEHAIEFVLSLDEVARAMQPKPPTTEKE